MIGIGVLSFGRAQAMPAGTIAAHSHACMSTADVYPTACKAGPHAMRAAVSRRPKRCLRRT